MSRQQVAFNLFFNIWANCLPVNEQSPGHDPGGGKMKYKIKGSEAEEGEDLTSGPEDSNDSWATSEEFSSDYILRYGSRYWGA